MHLIPALSFLITSLTGPSGPVPEGISSRTITTSRAPIDTFCYKPHNAKVDRIIVVMHGTLRNALTYRDDAIAMADRFQALVIAPKFDQDRFPSRLYQRGGILNADGTAAKPEDRTYPLVREVVDAIRNAEGRRLPFWVIGHSAGGQFVVRMAAFGSIGAERMVAANAGSHVFATRDLPFGYGFGSLPETISSDDQIRNYLAAPLTLYQGTSDNKSDEYLDESADAMKQGPGRYQRALASFDLAKKLASERGWSFNWRLVIAPGIEHDHTKMFNHPRCAEALFGRAIRDCLP